MGTATGDTTVVDVLSPADAVPARPQRRDAARNRELLLAAAREVFARRGTEASLDDVARHAGLGVGTAYRHFANKNELLRALMAEMTDKIVERAEHAATLDDPWEGMVSFMDGAMSAQAMDRGLREVMMGVHDPELVEQIQDRLTGSLNAIVRRAKRANLVRSDLETADVAMIVAMLCTVADITSGTDPEQWKRYLGICLEGLKPGAAKLPTKALAEAQMRAAMATHKQSAAQH